MGYLRDDGQVIFSAEEVAATLGLEDFEDIEVLADELELDDPNEWTARDVEAARGLLIVHDDPSDYEDDDDEEDDDEEDEDDESPCSCSEDDEDDELDEDDDD